MLAQLPVIESCEYRSSHVIFSDDVIYADIGDSENFIFEYTNNILRLKGRKTEKATNLTVITEGEDYYSFLVEYREVPRLNYFITKQSRTRSLAKEKKIPLEIMIPQPGKNKKGTVAKKEAVKPSGGEKKSLPGNRPDIKKTTRQEAGKSAKGRKETGREQLERTAWQLAGQTNLFNHIGGRHGDIRLKVTGIYHDFTHCFIVYTIQNRGAVPYDISYIEFGVKENRRPKKSALNEMVVTPLFTLQGENTRVHPRRLNRYVAVFEKLAIPQGKTLYMEVVENGRNFTLDIPYNRLPIESIKSTR